MTDQAGVQVRIRFMPHHDHRVEVYHATTGRYLGSADLADQATEEQVSAVRRERAARAGRAGAIRRRRPGDVRPAPRRPTPLRLERGHPVTAANRCPSPA
ncbi:hypothetical protein [Streptomyces sp. TP-A0356]|uniref:hypothetical protein n=1 Tax=Streptomyces sp. TP-A0356 TaxID=1359208 RepID=UPI001F15FE58|nr:hypothetical protein [Streptomyces sp. TP-A0356]